MTLGEFRFHIAGLLFIALNRVISPAFYAQKKPKLPTIAGLINFSSNILLVLLLSHPMGGNGIALALSLASLANTIFLFVFMKKMEAMEVGRLVKGTILYCIKMCIYSVIAAVPCYFAHAFFVKLFDGYGRLLSYGLPILFTGILFAAIGVIELIITKDEIVRIIARKVRK